MQTKFRRHQRVKLLVNPDPEYIEYHTENTDDKEIPIRAGMTGEINMLVSNGQYHVKVLDEKGRELAYVLIAEEYLEAI